MSPPVASVVHDLAQPLTAVSSASELLVTDWDGLTEDDRRDLAVRIDRGVRRLVEIVRSAGCV